MYIQLAERRPKKRRTRVSGYTRRRNTVRSHYRSLSEDSPDADNPFVYIPEEAAIQYGLPGNVQIREDYLDFLSPSEWRMLMAQIAQYQPAVYEGTMSEGMFMADRAARKAKREARQQKKEDRNKRRNTRREAKDELIKSRAQAKREGRGSDVLGSLIDGAKNIFGATAGGGAAPEDYAPPSNGGDDDKETPWYQTTGGMIGIGVGVLALAGGAYALTRK